MANKNSVIVSLVDTDNNVSQKTLSNINPDASDGAIKTFCKQLFGLSDDTVTAITRVEHTDVTNAVDRNPYFTASSNVINIFPGLGEKGTKSVDISYEGVYRNVTFSGQKPLGSTPTENNFTIFVRGKDGMYIGGDASCTMTLTLEANDKYDEATLDITFVGLDDSEIVDI